MKQTNRVVQCLTALIFVFAASAACVQDDYSTKFGELSAAVEKKVIEWRHHIHQNPELSNPEFKTAKRIADHLKSIGFDEVRTELGKTGVIGILKGKAGELVVTLRADMDALPIRELPDVPFESSVVDEDYAGGAFPVSHARGHDAHVAMLMVVD